MSEEQKPPGEPSEPLPTTPPPHGEAPPPPAPPGPPPPAPPRRDRAALAVVVFVFGGLFLVFFAFLILAYSAVRGESPRLSSGPRIGVVEVKGEIGGGVRGNLASQEVLKVVKRFLDDA